LAIKWTCVACATPKPPATNQGCRLKHRYSIFRPSFSLLLQLKYASNISCSILSFSLTLIREISESFDMPIEFNDVPSLIPAVSVRIHLSCKGDFGRSDLAQVAMVTRVNGGRCSQMPLQ